jgi:hypothetical protein
MRLRFDGMVWVILCAPILSGVMRELRGKPQHSRVTARAFTAS